MTDPGLEAPVAAARNRVPLLIGGTVLALLVGYLLIQALTGGGDSKTTTPETSATIVPRVRTTTTTAPRATAETFEIFTTKNPFVPLRSPAGGGGGGSTTATTAGGTTGGTTATTSVANRTGAAGTSTGGASGTTSGGGSTAPRQGTRVAVLDVFTEGGKVMANVKVNDTVSKVAVGQTFATNFKATSLSQSTGCGQFLFGDEPFRLCKGEETLK